VLLEEDEQGDVGRARPLSGPPDPTRSSFTSLDSATPLMSASLPYTSTTDNFTSPPPRSSRRAPSSTSSRRFLGRSARRDLSTVESVSLSSEGACAETTPADRDLWEEARERRWGSERSNGGRREGSGTETVRTTRTGKGREGIGMGSIKGSSRGDGGKKDNGGGGWFGSWWS
jgi:hypothetical protein